MRRVFKIDAHISSLQRGFRSSHLLFRFNCSSSCFWFISFTTMVILYSMHTANCRRRGVLLLRFNEFLHQIVIFCSSCCVDEVTAVGLCSVKSAGMISAPLISAPLLSSTESSAQASIITTSECGPLFHINMIYSTNLRSTLRQAYVYN